MSNTRLPEIAADILAELERGEPDVAARVRAIVSAAGLELDLLLEPEPDAFVHDLAAGVTAILGVRASGRAPWATGDTLRWSEPDFVRTNGTTLSVTDVIALQELSGNQPGLLAKLVDSCVIRGELMREEIPISDDELQTGIDEFRQKHQLLTVRETEAWLEAQRMDLDALEAHVTNDLRLAKLKQRVVGARVAEELERELSAWDVVTLSELVLAAGEPVPDAAGLVTAMALRRSQLLERRFRRDLPGELASRLEPGLVGPLDAARGRMLYRIWGVEPARRDERTRVAVTNRLFEEWLAARRLAANIEWNEPPRS